MKDIIASTTNNGMTVVVDTRELKPVVTFSDSNRSRGSILQWNPNQQTQLIVASDDDSPPSPRVWDLRNTSLPVSEFVGHIRGVIAMSWCHDDSSYLVTCGKDNRTICWNVFTGKIACDLSNGSLGNFDVHWLPIKPGFLSTSSYDGKIGIYKIEAYNNVDVQDGASSLGSSTSRRQGAVLPSPTVFVDILTELKDEKKKLDEEEYKIEEKASDAISELMQNLEYLSIVSAALYSFIAPGRLPCGGVWFFVLMALIILLGYGGFICWTSFKWKRLKRKVDEIEGKLLHLKEKMMQLEEKIFGLDEQCFKLDELKHCFSDFKGNINAPTNSYYNNYFGIIALVGVGLCVPLYLCGLIFLSYHLFCDKPILLYSAT